MSVREWRVGLPAQSEKANDAAAAATTCVCVCAPRVCFSRKVRSSFAGVRAGLFRGAYLNEHVVLLVRSATRHGKMSTKACPTCNKTVYFAEELQADGKYWHKGGCFKCQDCGTPLSKGQETSKKGDGRTLCKVSGRKRWQNVTDAARVASRDVMQSISDPRAWATAAPWAQATDERA